MIKVKVLILIMFSQGGDIIVDRFGVKSCDMQTVSQVVRRQLQVTIPIQIQKKDPITRKVHVSCKEIAAYTK